MSDFLYSNNYNPDVLSCLANLSNDEVFTPPQVVNDMLDMLPKELWHDKDAKFLDPACKSGVFLREIAKRLLEGLRDAIPNLQQRIDHIFQNQLYGIAITELTSLLSRRSVYCSKYPNSIYSVSQFGSAIGNIRYKNTQHRWKNGRCVFCGASENGDYGDKNRKGLETHAYEFIHTTKPEEIYKMKFDVIIGNPPYQMGDGGGMGSSALPIYQKFIQQAIKLQPRYLSMIVPARWFTGGRGLDEFRDEMLHDRRIRVIHDFINEKDCFPGVTIKGGVCYFLWDRENKGDCNVFSHSENTLISQMNRPLLENGCETFIRFNEAISLFRRVHQFNETSFSNIVSANDPFGFDVRVENSYKRIKPVFKLSPFKNSVAFYYNGWRKDGIGYISRDCVSKNVDLIDKWKILIPKAWGIGNIKSDWLNPIIANMGSCCTETYLVVGPFNNKEELKNAFSYMQTKFFHALVSLIKISQNTMKKAYSFVPMQDFSKPWNDKELYAKYGLADDEIKFIESMIKPMDISDGDNIGK